MIRAFLALSLPDPVRSALRVQQFLLPLPRAVDPDSFHLTLVFLGEHPEPVLSEAHEAFAAIKARPFTLALQGLGLFGGEKPRAAWAGVAPSPELTHLQAKLEQAARLSGITLSHRRFVPHVTLGRFVPPPPDVAMRLERAVAGGMDFRSEPFDVTEFAVYESRLSPKGSHYDELARYPLG